MIFVFCRVLVINALNFVLNAVFINVKSVRKDLYNSAFDSAKLFIFP